LLIAKLCREFESGFPITNANSRAALAMDCDLATARAPRSAVVDRGTRRLRLWEHRVDVRRFRMKPLCCQPVSAANAGVSGS
jgi:hypothetical protein